MKRALIIGITGQDGAYLARHLLLQGYEVVGASRDARASSLAGLAVLGIQEKVRVAQMAPNDFRSVLQVLSKVRPDEIYNLSGQSSVAVSFEQPIETIESMVVATGNLLEAIRFLQLDVKFYNACSSECFGDTAGKPATELTPFHPRSPYAVAKASTYWLVANYREAYGIYACSGILFNHESPLRPERFVTRKIASSAVRIAGGNNERLKLGNVSVVRDWGWAPEYVAAMHSMLQLTEPTDLVVATGTSISLKELIKSAFEAVDLDWEQHVDYDNRLLRPSDVSISKANPDKAANILGWSATVSGVDVMRRLVECELSGKYPSGY